MTSRHRLCRVKISALDQVSSKIDDIAVPYPTPVMNTIKRPNLFLGESCSRRTPEIGRSSINTSDIIVHAANGIESLILMLSCDPVTFPSQVCPGGGASPITATIIQIT